MPKKVLNNIQVFNSYFINKIKDLCIDKSDEKSCLIVYIYNDEKKNFMLMYLSKIPETS